MTGFSFLCDACRRFRLAQFQNLSKSRIIRLSSSGFNFYKDITNLSTSVKKNIHSVRFMLHLWETCLQIFLKVRELTKKIIQCIRGKNTSWKDPWQKMWQVSLSFCFSKYIKIQAFFSNVLFDKWNKLLPNTNLYLHSFLCYINIIWL